MNKNDLHLIKKALLARDKVEERAINRILSQGKEPTAKFIDELDKSKIELFDKARPHLSAARIATIAAVAAILLSLTVLSASALRESVIDFFVKYFDDHVEIDVDRSNSDGYGALRIPTYIPDGYDCTAETCLENYAFYTWENGDLKISFMTNAVTGDSTEFINTEGDEFGTVEIRGTVGYYNKSDGNYGVYWAEEDADCILSIPESLGLEEAVKIAESLSPAE